MSETAVDFDTTNTCKAVVKESTRITPASTDEVRHIVLEVEDPAFRFVEGQTIGVLVPGPHEFGNPYHHRRYSIANARASDTGDSGVQVSILVRRCFYVDEVSGERYPGIASNYLCDAATGDQVTLTGPYRSPFRIPSDPNSNLLMIGIGTGIAPFRGFAQRIYSEKSFWKGQVRLFYGARTGMDLYYMNDLNDDLANYYDEATFKAFQALSLRPLSRPDQALQDMLAENAAEAWELIQQPQTYVYLAGIDRVQEALDKTMIQAAGSEELWESTKARLKQEGRWAELLYS